MASTEVLPWSATADTAQVVAAFLAGYGLGTRKSYAEGLKGWFVAGG